MFRMIRKLKVYMLVTASLALGATIVLAGASPGGADALGNLFFRVDWTAKPSQQGESTITGYVYNDYGLPARSVRLRITGLDTQNQLIQVDRPVRGLVPAEGRAYFEVKVPHGGSYQDVSVASFDFMEFPSK